MARPSSDSERDEPNPACAQTRLLAEGPDAITDNELLELVLTSAFEGRKRDLAAVASALLQRFTSFAEVIAAPKSELRRVDELGDSGAAALKAIHAAALRLVRNEVVLQPVLSSWKALFEYLTAVSAREAVEQLRLLFLDSRGCLISDEEQGRGTVNHVPAYPREIAKRAMELQAATVIMVHNHPSGSPAPSPQDLSMTMQISDALRVVDVLLYDHVIIGREAFTSFREAGLLGRRP